ncbi:MAG TPA: hypothetical protein VEF90_14090 [Xanthobacteraceae bacterium]|nr:hypothetical protein [Xanthobacteraceae bacterium]
MLLLILWLVFAVLIGAAARTRGRNGVGWFLLAILLSPLFAGLILAILPDLRTRALLEDIRNAGRAADDEIERARSRSASQ